ncbi:MAG: Gfo/Idh/MocA family oxidoreductase [Alteraurantiacibacter sp.]
MGIRLGIVGVGKIVHDQHVAAIAASPHFMLTATADPYAAPLPGVPHYASLAAMLEAAPDIAAVAICTTPQARDALVFEAIAHGLHVLAEKPPATDVSRGEDMASAARLAGVTLFAAWHSRMAAGVAPARAWLASKAIERISIVWREDVCHWHPGQLWIDQPGGMGVFDPGINALSILTALLAEPVTLVSASLDVPANWQTPIAARLTMHTLSGVPIAADFDFRQQGPQTWQIAIETNAGTLALDLGGAQLTLPGEPPAEPALAAPDGEYAALYARFAELIGAGQSDFDLAPLALVADACRLGERRPAPPFHH